MINSGMCLRLISVTRASLSFAGNCNHIAEEALKSAGDEFSIPFAYFHILVWKFPRATSECL